MAININIPSQFREYNNLASFPATGDAKILYVAKNNNKLYRWDTSAYVEVSPQLASSWGSITGNLASQVDLQGALDNKVNTEAGKGLSTNDYTTTEKNKLAGIASGAEVNVNADWNATSGDAEILNKPTIPSIAGLATTSYVDSQDATKQDVLVSGTNVKTVEGQSILGSGNIDLSKSDVGLGNVDNTSDANKPVSTATQTALDAKQDTLVSGTNIKTINGTTVLGSGDITIGGGTPEWGDITGDLFNQTDLQAQLDSKQEYLFSGTNIKTINSTSVLGSGDLAVQPTLVSGTNIKTINGNTLLGSGNLTISGGGGGTSVPIPQVPTIGYMNSLYNTNSAAPTIVNNMYLFPFIPMNDINTSSIIIQVTTAQAGSTGKMVVYSSTSQGLPSTLLVESTALDCSTTGFKTFSSSKSYTANTKYWIGFVGSVSNINTTSNSMTPIIGVRTNANSVYNCLLFSITYPTIPATVTTSSASFNNQPSCPRITFVQ